MINGINIRDEWPENSKETKNSPKQASWSRLQEVTGKIEENSSWDTQVPNPKKASLNYIENMGEWESTKKKYEDTIALKQLELASIMSSYENKWEELDRFRKAKSELEIELIKVMWSITNKLMEHNDFIKHIFDKLNINSDWVNIEDVDDGDEEIETEAENQLNETEKEIMNDNNDNNKLAQLQNMLSTAWIISIGLDSTSIAGITEDSEYLDQKFFDIVTSIIENFLEIVNQENRESNKTLLDDEEIKQVESIYSFIKGHSIKYLDLLYQINIIDSKIAMLDSEETNIGIDYYNWKKELEKLAEEFQVLSESYFLNSYLSTKNASLDDFVTSKLVEKQITHIIQACKEWQPIPKTILLYWKPNLGKTYAANVLATELWRTMYHIRSFDIFTWWFSDPNAMLDAIFNSVIKKKEPCIVFLDEIENFSQWYDWSPYSNLIENTIRHHISKIKESKLDIMIIWAISNRTKVSPSLLKQDIFSKQIYFDSLPEDKCIEFINMIAKADNINIWSDIDKEKFVKDLKDNEQNQEFLKKLIDEAIDFHKLDNWDVENITLTNKDFDEALRHMREYSRIFQGVWF